MQINLSIDDIEIILYALNFAGLITKPFMKSEIFEKVGITNVECTNRYLVVKELLIAQLRQLGIKVEEVKCEKL